MKKVILFLFLLTGKLSAQPLKVLFVGNSYTASNNLAVMFTQLALSLGDSVAAYSVNPGGYTFQLHTAYLPTLQMIDSMDWDFVVLQEQSQLPSFPPAQVAVDVFPYARKLDSLIHLNNACTETVFFMTWGRKYGDASNCAFYPPVCTFMGMQQELRNNYVAMANQNHALVAPVGEAWKRSWMNDSTINLWISDNSHPDLPGSYLASCVFYATIFRKSTAGASYTAGLSPTVAAFLQSTADTTVFDSLAVWKIGAYDVTASSTFSANGLNVQFNNTSVNATTYLWDFGDGNFDTISQPVHSYLQPGNYTVTLLAGDSCTTDTFIFSVPVSASAVVPVKPSPCVQPLGNGQFQLDCDGFRTLEIYDIQGRRVSAISIRGSKEVIVEVPEAGFYTLVFQGDMVDPWILRSMLSR